METVAGSRVWQHITLPVPSLWRGIDKASSRLPELPSAVREYGLRAPFQPEPFWPLVKRRGASESDCSDGPYRWHGAGLLYRFGIWCRGRCCVGGPARGVALAFQAGGAVKKASQFSRLPTRRAGRPLVREMYQCRRTRSAPQYIKRCSGVLYIFVRERESVFWDWSSGLVPNSDRQRGERHAIASGSNRYVGERIGRSQTVRERARGHYSANLRASGLLGIGCALR
jgi:hypothetical protein